MQHSSQSLPPDAPRTDHTLIASILDQTAVGAHSLIASALGAPIALFTYSERSGSFGEPGAMFREKPWHPGADEDDDPCKCKGNAIIVGPMFKLVTFLPLMIRLPICVHLKICPNCIFVYIGGCSTGIGPERGPSEPRDDDDKVIEIDESDEDPEDREYGGRKIRVGVMPFTRRRITTALREGPNADTADVKVGGFLVIYVPGCRNTYFVQFKSKQFTTEFCPRSNKNSTTEFVPPPKPDGGTAWEFDGATTGVPARDSAGQLSGSSYTDGQFVADPDKAAMEAAGVKTHTIYSQFITLIYCDGILFGGVYWSLTVTFHFTCNTDATSNFNRASKPEMKKLPFDPSNPGGFGNDLKEILKSPRSKPPGGSPK